MIIKSVKSINPCISVIQTSYDMITKGYDGGLTVESKVNEGTKFIIQLPIHEQK